MASPTERRIQSQIPVRKNIRLPEKENREPLRWSDQREREAIPSSLPTTPSSLRNRPSNENWQSKSPFVPSPCGYLTKFASSPVKFDIQRSSLTGQLDLAEHPQTRTPETLNWEGASDSRSPKEKHPTAPLFTLPPPIFSLKTPCPSNPHRKRSVPGVSESSVSQEASQPLLEELSALKSEFCINKLSPLPGDEAKASSEENPDTPYSLSSRLRNTVDMPDPTFSGRAGDNINWYLRQVKFKWKTSGLDAADMEEAQIASILQGCTGPARHFVMQQPPSVTDNLKALSDALKAQFPWTPPRSDGTISKRIIELSQGTKSIEAYVKEAIELKPYVTQDYQSLFVERWIGGISGEALRYSVNYAVEQRKNQNSQTSAGTSSGLPPPSTAQNISIDAVIDIVSAIIGGLSTATEPSKSTEELFKDSLSALTKKIETMQIRAVQSYPPSRQTPASGPTTAPTAPAYPSQQKRNDMVCWKCGRSGHGSRFCTFPALPPEDQQRIRDADLARKSATADDRRPDPPLSQTLPRQPAVSAQVQTSGTQLQIEQARAESSRNYVEHLEANDPRIAEWDDDLRVYEIKSSQYVGSSDVLKTAAKPTGDARSSLEAVYKVGGIRRSRNEMEESSDTPERVHDPHLDREPGKPQKLKRIKGLQGERLNVWKKLNEIGFFITVSQLADLSPTVRQLINKMIQTEQRQTTKVKRAKGKEPAVGEPGPSSKRSKMNKIDLVVSVGTDSDSSGSSTSAVHLGMAKTQSVVPCKLLSNSSSNEHHDDIFQPRDPSAGDLFYTDAAIFAMDVNRGIRGAHLKRVLLDGGSETNLVSNRVVEKLQPTTVKIGCSTMVLADGSRTSSQKAAWFQIVIQGCTRTIAAIILPGDPSHQLLLGRHYMQSAGILGDYMKGEYTLLNDRGKRVNVTRTDPANPPPTMTPAQLANLNKSSVVQVDTAKLKSKIQRHTVETSELSDEDESAIDAEIRKQLKKSVRLSTTETEGGNTQYSDLENLKLPKAVLKRLRKSVHAAVVQKSLEKDDPEYPYSGDTEADSENY